jgi:hypothetical protein
MERIETTEGLQTVGLVAMGTIVASFRMAWSAAVTDGRP